MDCAFYYVPYWETNDGVALIICVSHIFIPRVYLSTSELIWTLYNYIVT
jgi:hypothetical protein